MNPSYDVPLSDIAFTIPLDGANSGNCEYTLAATVNGGSHTDIVDNTAHEIFSLVGPTFS